MQIHDGRSDSQAKPRPLCAVLVQPVEALQHDAASNSGDAWTMIAY